MVLQSTGSISLSDIQNELGGIESISLSEYYRDDYYSVGIPGIPNSGNPISMSAFRGKTNIKRDGLVLYLDPNDINCYTSGDTLQNLTGSETCTINGTYEQNSDGTIYLKDNTHGTNIEDYLLNVSCIQCPSMSIRTISLWYLQYSTANDNSRYLLDARTGDSDGYIWFRGHGRNWTNATMYIDGGSAQTFSWNAIENLEVWQNITIVANALITDDLTIFGRYSLTEALDVAFGPIMIYDRELTEQENKDNYDYIISTRSFNNPFFQYFNNTYISDGEFFFEEIISKPANINKYVINKIMIDSYLGAYLYDGPEVTTGFIHIRYLKDPNSITKLYDRYGSMTNYNPNNRLACIDIESAKSNNVFQSI